MPKFKYTGELLPNTVAMLSTAESESDEQQRCQSTLLPSSILGKVIYQWLIDGKLGEGSYLLHLDPAPCGMQLKLRCTKTDEGKWKVLAEVSMPRLDHQRISVAQTFKEYAYRDKMTRIHHFLFGRYSTEECIIPMRPATVRNESENPWCAIRMTANGKLGAEILPSKGYRNIRRDDCTAFGVRCPTEWDCMPHDCNTKHDRRRYERKVMRCIALSKLNEDETSATPVQIQLDDAVARTSLFGMA